MSAIIIMYMRRNGSHFALAGALGAMAVTVIWSALRLALQLNFSLTQASFNDSQYKKLNIWIVVYTTVTLLEWMRCTLVFYHIYKRVRHGEDLPDVEGLLCSSGEPTGNHVLPVSSDVSISAEDSRSATSKKRAKRNNKSVSFGDDEDGPKGHVHAVYGNSGEPSSGPTLARARPATQASRNELEEEAL